MTTAIADGPNANSAATVQNPVSDESLFAKMTAMRNQTATTEPAGTGSEKSAPVVPQASEVLDDTDMSAEPEVDPTEEYGIEEASEESDSPSAEVSDDNSTAEDLIDFIEFADSNPNAKFKFMKNGKEVVIDAKKAAAILGQGGAIHEEARQLKIEKANFDEYLQEKTQQAEGLLLAMEFTVRPQIQKAYDEILKTQNYQTTFKQQLAQTQDPAQIARIQAAMQQNEQYIQQQSSQIRQLKPQVDQFYQMREAQVKGVLEQSRKSFTDAELKNEYVYNELRDKLGKSWKNAEQQFVPGVKNLDLVSSDEYLMSLVRDGLKYREKPRVKSAGNSIAALTSKRVGAANNSSRGRDETEQLRERAKSGDKKAADNLLMSHLSKIRAARNGR